MKVGLVARSEDRGLGNVTWEWARNMRPDRVLLIHPSWQLARHDERYAEFPTWVVGWGGEQQFANEATVRDFLDGLDVVYSAETFYDWRLCEWARDLHVRTVCHVMPEYFRADPAKRADVWWLPTSWRASRLPPSARRVPVPIPLDRWPTPPTRSDGPIRWLHVAGSPAAADRNGTRLFIAALGLTRRAHEVTIRSQQPIARAPVASRTRLRVVDTSVRDYWRMYDEHDALVLPRRYGGLTMPALEAMGAGLALLMPSIEPQVTEWPILGFPARCRGSINAIAGEIPLYESDVRAIAKSMDTLAVCPLDLLDARLRARAWAEAHSWARCKELIVEELEYACSM